MPATAAVLWRRRGRAKDRRKGPNAPLLVLIRSTATTAQRCGPAGGHSRGPSGRKYRCRVALPMPNRAIMALRREGGDQSRTRVQARMAETWADDIEKSIQPRSS